MYKITTNNFHGVVEIPYSKSTCHRALIIAVLKRDITIIDNINLCYDINATIDIIKKIGCQITIKNNSIIIDSSYLSYNFNVLDAKESGTTLRLVIPMMLYLFNKVKITGSETLMKRPLDGYNDFFKKNNIDFEIKQQLFIATGEITTVNCQINNLKSSQFVTGLLLIAPLVNDFNITLVDNNSSMGYIDMTIDICQQFKVKMIKEDLKIFGLKQSYQGVKYKNEVDESSYTFFLTAQLLGCDIKIINKNKQTKQPDKEYERVIKFNVIDIDKMPDSLPIGLIYSIVNQKNKKFINCQRTRYKESNRLDNMVNQLQAINCNIKIVENDIIIIPSYYNRIVHVKAYNDHRIAMSFLILSIFVEEVYIDNIRCINKSYPTFITDFKRLGGKIEELHD